MKTFTVTQEKLLKTQKSLFRRDEKVEVHLTAGLLGQRISLRPTKSFIKMKSFKPSHKSPAVALKSYLKASP